jgi:ribonucleoside-diphosphate reductase alpha chain
MAQSIIDYIFRWLELKFLKPEVDAVVDAALPVVAEASVTFINQSDAPMCSNCGNMTVRSGSCSKCMVCGTSNGCS